MAIFFSLKRNILIILSAFIVIYTIINIIFNYILLTSPKSKNRDKKYSNNTINEFIKLNNGVLMPKIGLGVYNIPKSLTKKCVLDAISLGYRSIDTAQLYGNEKEVGEAVRASSIPRNELFITTKLWECQGYLDAIQSIETSLNRLNIGYIDLLLIHEPRGDFVEIYRALEDYYKQGKLKSIGVSNFYENDFMKLINNTKIIPQINQVETHVFFQQKTFQSFLKKYGTQIEAWSPLAAGNNDIFNNSVLSEVAKKHNKSTAQVALRFLYQQDIIIIPKSTNIKRMKDNISITDFELTESEMDLIRSLDTGKSLFDWY